MVSKFVWHEIHTPDLAAAKSFYGELMGWTFNTMDMGEAGTYDIIANGDPNGIGGMATLDGSTGAPPHWVSYLTTKGSVDEACETITKAGGQVIAPAFDIPGVGRMAVASDPNGAVFCPFSVLEGMPEPTANYFPGKGNPIWNELLAADPAASAEFYCELTGWGSYVADMGTGPYTLLTNEFSEAAGILKFPEGVSTPAWLTYFEVAQDTVEEALAKVTELGGQVGMGPMVIPQVGTIAVVGDSTGAWFGLMKSVPRG